MSKWMAVRGITTFSKITCVKNCEFSSRFHVYTLWSKEQFIKLLCIVSKIQFARARWKVLPSEEHAHSPYCKMAFPPLVSGVRDWFLSRFLSPPPLVLAFVPHQSRGVCWAEKVRCQTFVSSSKFIVNSRCVSIKHETRLVFFSFGAHEFILWINVLTPCQQLCAKIRYLFVVVCCLLEHTHKKRRPRFVCILWRSLLVFFSSSSLFFPVLWRRP